MSIERVQSYLQKRRRDYEIDRAEALFFLRIGLAIASTGFLAAIILAFMSFADPAVPCAILGIAGVLLLCYGGYLNDGLEYASPVEEILPDSTLLRSAQDADRATDESELLRAR